MRLRDHIARLARKVEYWAIGMPEVDLTDIPLAPPTPAEGQATKGYIDFTKPGYLANISRKTKPDRVLGAIQYLPTGAYDSGPGPADSKHLNELYNNSDNYGMLPTGHYYLFIDGEPVNVVKNMRIEGEWDHIYLDTWNRHGFRVNYEQDTNE